MPNKNNPPDRQYQERIIEKAEMLKAMANPIRLCLLTKLVETGEMNVSQITSCMDVSQSAVSQHLGKLRLLGIVQARKRGNKVFYACVRNDIRELIKLVFKES